MSDAKVVDYTRTVKVAGREFKLAPLTEAQLGSLFTNPDPTLKVWEQWWYAIYASMMNAGATPMDLRMNDLTVPDVHLLLQTIGEIHGGIPQFALMDSDTALKITRTSSHIQ